MFYRKKRVIFLNFFIQFLFLLILLNGFTQAQEKEIEKIKKFIKKKRVNAAYIMFGANIASLRNLNMFLDNMSLPTTGESFLSYGLGGHVIHNKLVVGLEIVKSSEKNGSGMNDFSTSLSFRYIAVNLGYLMHSKNGLMLYPYGGLGLGRLTLRLTENNIVSINDITAFQRSSESYVKTLIANLGFALDFFYKYNSKKKGQNNLVVGLRAGYLFSPHRFSWRVNHIQVDDGINQGINGPYIRIVVGFGGWIEKLIKKAL